MIRVAVIGAAGRMGTVTCGAVERDDDLELAARIGRNDSLDRLSDADVAVDFTTPQAVKDNVRACLEHGVHVVVGTTGLSDDDVGEIEQWARKHGRNVFIAPNFARGAVLMMWFAQQAARHFAAVEIVERHSEKKLDAPSGTSKRTASLMRPGGEVPIHSLRLPGSVAHQEVIFGSPGETLTIRHDSVDRASFMPGVLLAVKNVASLDGVTVGLERLLEL